MPTPVTLLDRLDVAVTRTISRRRGKYESGFTINVVAEWDWEDEDVRVFLSAAPAMIELFRAAEALRKSQNTGESPRLGNCPHAERVDDALDVLLGPSPPMSTTPTKRRK